MNEKTTQNEDIKRKIEAAGMNGQAPIATFDEKAPVHAIETQVANQVLQMLGAVPYAQAAPIIQLLATSLRPLEGAPDG